MANHTHDLSLVTRGHMSDADRLMDCLSSAKERAMLYARSALECTNNGVREFFLALHGEETYHQEILFSFLHTRGFYPTEMVTQDRIKEVRQRYHEIHNQMGLTDNPSFRRYQTADPFLPPAAAEQDDRYDYKSDRH